MAVKTKSIYEPTAPEDGLRLLITRYYPRGVRKERFDRWVKPLAPSAGLLKSYRAGEKSWGQFRMLFLAELASNEESAKALEMVRLLAKRGDVTLLCFEKPGLHCHRYVVQKLLTQPKLHSARRGLKSAGRKKQASAEIRFYPRRRVGRKAT